jgi:uncharacterized protein YndB with AHSA1/START domain
MERYPYEIVSTWRVAGDIGAVFDVLTDAPSLPRWWPEAYQRVREVARGDPETGRGRISEITTRGVLPYDVNWRLEGLEAVRPTLIRVAASGDLTGVGEWRLRQDGPDVVLVYDWRVRVEKPWMRKIEFLLKPAFTLNHNWVMRRGERGLRAELIRRAAPREA